MECPTCFQKLTVPQAPQGESAKFILTASKVQSRPTPQVAVPNEPMPRKKESPLVSIGLILVFGALIAVGLVFHEKIFKHAPEQNLASANSTRSQSEHSGALPANDRNWTLDLAGVKIPDETAAGKINGRDFICQRSTLHGGTLDLRQGPEWPPDLGLTLYLTTGRAEDLAGRTVHIPAGTQNPPRVKLRWKNEQGEPQTRNIRSGYTCTVEFGEVNNEHLRGKIYICIPDKDRSWVAGTFDAEIREPSQ